MAVRLRGKPTGRFLELRPQNCINYIFLFATLAPVSFGHLDACCVSFVGYVSNTKKTVQVARFSCSVI